LVSSVAGIFSLHARKHLAFAYACVSASFSVHVARDGFNGLLLAGVGQVTSGWYVGINGMYYIFASILVLNTQLLISANFMLCRCFSHTNVNHMAQPNISRHGWFLMFLPPTWPASAGQERTNTCNTKV
jgi:hypothetical protein